jgi:hypothetical protein
VLPEAVDAGGATARAVALNDHTVDTSPAKFRDDPVRLALEMDGHDMVIRHVAARRGPNESVDMLRIETGGLAGGRDRSIDLAAVPIAGGEKNDRRWRIAHPQGQGLPRLDDR